MPRKNFLIELKNDAGNGIQYFLDTTPVPFWDLPLDQALDRYYGKDDDVVIPVVQVDTFRFDPLLLGLTLNQVKALIPFLENQGSNVDNSDVNTRVARLIMKREYVTALKLSLTQSDGTIATLDNNSVGNFLKGHFSL